MNVYSQIASNKRTTYLFMTGFIVLIVLLSYLFGEIQGSGLSFAGIALIISGVMSFGSYFYSDSIILALTHARPADAKRDFNLISVTENMAIAAGLPKPRVYVIDDPAPNAFATGRDPQHAAIAATTGLLERLDRTELEGVIAHELGHVKNYDIRLMAIVTVLAGVIVLMTDIFMRSMWLGGGRRDERGSGGNLGAVFMILGVVMALIAPLIATIMKLAVSRKREYLADASGAYLTRNPGALADALEKIAADPRPLQAASNATAHLFFSNPFKKRSHNISWFATLFNTHPPMEERVKLLRAM